MFIKKYFQITIFLLLAAAIMAPLYAPGFVFLTDMVAGPHLTLASLVTNGLQPQLPLEFLMFLFNLVLSGAVVQKIILTFMLFLPGYAMYLLARRFLGRALAVGSGMMYMINPYVFERLIVGHWMVLLGYGFFPLMVLCLIWFIERPSWRRLAILSLVYSCYPLVNLHWAYIATGFMNIYGAVELTKKHAWRNLFKRKVLGMLGAFVLIFCLINSFWILNNFGPTGTLSHISLGDFQAFSTLSDPQFGVYFNVLSLYGIWDTSVLTPKDFFALWWVVTPVMLLLGVLGAYRETRRGTALAWAIAIAFVPALLLAVGYGSAVTRPIINFLYYALPFFRGLRDTAKITGLIAFIYAFTVPAGASFVVSLFGKKATTTPTTTDWPVTIFVAIFPLLWSTGLVWGAHGQIAPHAYPTGWYSAESALRADSGTGKVLFLPWHAYLKLNFADDVLVANPASAFFSETMITGQDTDNRFLAAAEKSPWDEHVITFSDTINPVDRDFIKSEGVTHIVLAKTDDWEKFTGLFKSSFLEKVFEDESIAVFRVK